MATAQHPARLDLSVQRVASLQDCSQDEWNSLVDASTYPNVFRRWEWVSTWWKWFGQGRGLCILRVLEGQTVVAIVPLYVRADRFRLTLRPRTLTFLGFGGPTSPEYLGPIIHRDYADRAVGAIADFLNSAGSDWDVLHFPDVPPDDAETVGLIRALQAVRPSLACPGEVCPSLDLPKSYDLLLARLSSHGRQRKKRQLRRAIEECELRLDTLTTVDCLHAFFPAMTDLSSSSRRRAGEPSPFRNESYAGFHREVMAELSPGNMVILYVLRFHGSPVGFLYGFLYRNKYYAFQTGFDASLDRYSPGDVLYQVVFQDLIARNVGEFDYLRGEESYKKSFANQWRKTQTTYVYRRKALSHFAKWLEIGPVRRLVRLLKNRLRAVRKDGSVSDK